MSATRIQPALTQSEAELVDQMAQLTHAKRTDVIKNALAVYHWFLRHALTGASVAALTFYDMAKSVSHGIVIKEVRLLEKTGGKSDFRAPSPG